MQGPDLTGSVLDDRYRIFGRLGVGGMGAVYRGEHVMLGTPVAVKVLLPQLAHDNEWVQRFLQEARAASQIRHPNIVQIRDFAASRAGVVYMVMELLEGESLADLAKREGPLPWPRVARLCEQVAEALAAAHARGIIHRDIKPANIFRLGGPDEPDVIKVLDFGIAKFLATSDDDADNPRTATGIMMGTPEYMAPEVLEGMRPDARADVYALGVMMYKLLTGRVPFSGGHIAVAQQMVSGRPTPPSQVVRAGVYVASQVDALILRAIMREREARTASMAELLAALRACRDIEPLVHERPPAVEVKTAPRPRQEVFPAGMVSPSRSSAAPLQRVDPAPPPSEMSEEATLRRDNSRPSEPITDVKPVLQELASADVVTDRAELPRGVASSPPASKSASKLVVGGLLVGFAGVAVAALLQVVPSAEDVATPGTASMAPRAVDAAAPPDLARAGLGATTEPASEAVPPPPPGTGTPAPRDESVVAVAMPDAVKASVPEPPPIAPVSGKKPAIDASSPRKKKAEPAKDMPMPDALSSAAIVRRLEAIDARLQERCFWAHQVLPDTMVWTSVAVDPSGKATVKTRKSRSSAFVGCIAAEIEAFAFQASRAGGSAEYTFTAREE
ncbi:protein kinase [Nannocystis sp. ILAH1]|uniref:serine/threonine-protein kinase n=1 Tax=unclassified Nannocystis TaxID=2627009 RepID=UPI0022708CD5|nr:MULTISPECIES: serine/threonine-protein kinase [unclassified Nannocystis]MCY0994462.1 protein kinase [Nannocystis sp. ILAH1]MCY1063548.1 protein kinase [Nannocystis sp. RBIL2]